MEIARGAEIARGVEIAREVRKGAEEGWRLEGDGRGVETGRGRKREERRGEDGVEMVRGQGRS